MTSDRWSTGEREGQASSRISGPIKERYGVRRGVRSYVIRQARMSNLQRRSYELLHGTYVVPFQESAVDLAELFGTHRRSLGIGPNAIYGGVGRRDSADAMPAERPVILEVGFGMGEATAILAESNPDTDYLGVEVHRPGVGKLLSEIESKRLINLLIVQYDAVAVLEKMIPAQSLAGAHIFFPDPWPKKRHHKRRLVQRPFVELLASRIRSGGYLYLVTDWEEYAFQILDVLYRNELLRNTTIDFAAPQAWRPRTKFEEKGQRVGHEIFEILFRRM